MKVLTVLGITAAVVGGYVLIKNVGKASANQMPQQQQQQLLTNQGYVIPQTPNAYPMYIVPQGSLPQQSSVNVGLSTSGITYKDDKLAVELGTDLLSSIPILGTLFGSTDVQKQGVAKVTP